MVNIDDDAFRAMLQSTNVGTLLNDAIIVAVHDQVLRHQQWIGVANKLADLGAWQLHTHQCDIRIDLLLRRMEAEWIERREAQEAAPLSFITDLQATVSRYWLLSIYEAIRTAQQTGSGRSNDRLKRLRRKIEAVRVPLAKLQIANDSNLKETIFVGHEGDSIESASPYSRKERAPFTPGINFEIATGSIAWNVVDVDGPRMMTISRREISDDCLSLFDQ